MLNYLKRIFRGMLNPYVVPEQVWRLDGVGLVEIVGTEKHYLDKYLAGSTGVQWRRLGEAHIHSTTAYRFYRAAVLPEVLEEEEPTPVPEPLRLLPGKET